MQVYAIVYCPETEEVLVFVKKTCGYFFQRGTEKAVFYFKGKRNNGGGKRCFPGGRLNASEPPVMGAMREFREETGVDLGSFHNEIQPVRIKTPEYIGVIFSFRQDVFDVICTNCTTQISGTQGELKNLLKESRRLQGSRKSNEVKQFLAKNCGPRDDELESVERCNLRSRPSDFIQNDKDTGWFYEMWMNIKAKYNEKKMGIILGFSMFPDFEQINFE